MKTIASTSRTMINGAFLQEVKDANVELWHALHDMRRLINEPGEALSASKELVSLLGRLRDLLARQFSLEETYGYIDLGRSVPTVVSERSALARAQHQELYLRIHELCEQAEEAQYRGTAQRELSDLLKLAAEFDECLRAHEELESELISGYGSMPASSAR